MRESLAVGARVLVGLVFTYSGFIKAIEPPQEFAAVLEAYYLLPEAWLMPAATILPWLQLLCGVFLAAGYLSRTAAAAAAAMLAVFIFALISTKYKGIELADCGCFGSLRLPPIVTAALDAVLLALAAFVYRFRGGPWSLDGWIDAGAPG